MEHNRGYKKTHKNIVNWSLTNKQKQYNGEKIALYDTGTISYPHFLEKECFTKITSKLTTDMM
jgi:hypothetical protein